MTKTAAAAATAVVASLLLSLCATATHAQYPTAPLVPPTANNEWVANTKWVRRNLAAALPNTVPVACPGDGHTDCTAAINAAAAATINGIPANVYLTTGNYYVSGPITIGGGQVLYGDGSHNTSIVWDNRFATGAPGIIILNNANPNAAEIRDISFAPATLQTPTATLTGASITGTTLSWTSATGTPANGNLIYDGSTGGPGFVQLGATISAVNLGTKTATVSIVNGNVASETMSTALGRSQFAALGSCDNVNTGCAYPPAIYSNGGGRYRLLHIRCLLTWACIGSNPSVSNSGMLIDDVEDSSLNVGLQLDNVRDFAHLTHWHHQTFAASSIPPLLALFRDGANYSAQIGANSDVQDLTAVDYKSFIGRTTFNGTTSWSEWSSPSFNGSNADLEVTGAQWVLMTNANFSGHATGSNTNCPVNVTGGNVSLINTHFNGTSDGSNSVCETGGTLALVGGEADALVNTTTLVNVTGGTFLSTGVYYNTSAAVGTWSQNLISISGASTVLSFNANTFSAAPNTAATGLSVGVDVGSNSVQSNNFNGWTFFAPGNAGAYSPNGPVAGVGSTISGTTNIIASNAGVTHAVTGTGYTITFPAQPVIAPGVTTILAATPSAGSINVCVAAGSIFDANSAVTLVGAICASGNGIVLAGGQVLTVVAKVGLNYYATLATGAGTSAVSSVNGTAGQTTASPTTGNVIIGLASTITQVETFSATPLTVGGNAVAGTTVVVNGATSTSRGVFYQTAGSNRFFVGAHGDTESGNNTGSPYDILAYNDSGSFFGTLATGVRASGPFGTGAPRWQTFAPYGITSSSAASAPGGSIGNTETYTDTQPTATLATNPLTTVGSSAAVTVAWTNCCTSGSTALNLNTTSAVNISGAAAVNGLTPSGWFQVTSIVDANDFTITCTVSLCGAATASGSGVGGGASVAVQPSFITIGDNWKISWTNGAPGFEERLNLQATMNPSFYPTSGTLVGENVFFGITSPNDTTLANSWAAAIGELDVTYRGGAKGWYSNRHLAANLTEALPYVCAPIQGGVTGGGTAGFCDYAATIDSNGLALRWFNGYAISPNSLVGVTQDTVTNHGGVALPLNGSLTYLGSNPFACTSGSSTIKITVPTGYPGWLTSHSNGENIYISGSYNCNSTTFGAATYTISSVNSPAGTLSITGTGNASGNGTTGGTGQNIYFATDVPYATATIAGEWAHGETQLSQTKFDDSLMISMQPGTGIGWAATPGTVLVSISANSTGVVAGGGSATTGITAAGNSQGTATALTANVNVVSTTAMSTGVILPTLVCCQVFYVTNSGANTLSVYPPVGATIAGLALNAPASVSSGQTIALMVSSTTTLSQLSPSLTGSANLTVASSTITGGSNGDILYNNSGVLGSQTIYARFGNQGANSFLAAPNGTMGTPSFRVIAAADMPALANGAIYVGNISNVPVSNVPSGDCTITNVAVFTCTKTAGVAFGALATATTPLSGALGGTGVANTGLTLILGASFTTTGAGAPTLAFPSSSATYTFPTSSATLLSTSLTNGNIFIGNASNVATGVALSGDCTITNTGVLTCTKTNGTAFGALATATTPLSGALGGTGVANTGLLLTLNASTTLPSLPGSIQCLHENTSGIISTTGSDCGSGGGLPPPSASIVAWWVSTLGNDTTGTGTFANPYASLQKAINAAGPSATKLIYVRGGAYNAAATANTCFSNTYAIAMTAGNEGITVSYWPPDGVDSAVISFTGSPSIGLCIFNGANNTSVIGITFQNAVNSDIRIAGGSLAGQGATGILLSDNALSGTVGTGGFGGCIELLGNTEGTKILRNNIQNCAVRGITSIDNGVNGGPSNLDIEYNFISNFCTTQSDCGAIYLQNIQASISSAGFATGDVVSHNYITAPSQGAYGIYLDDWASYVTAQYNTILVGGSSATHPSCFIIHGGQNNVLQYNICDIGGAGGTLTGSQPLIQQNSTHGTPLMTGNTFQNSIVVANSTSSPAGNGYVAFGCGTCSPMTVPNPATIANNIYWNYNNQTGGVSGIANTSGNGSTADSNTTGGNSQIRCYIAAVDQSSPAYATPVFFSGSGTYAWGPQQVGVSINNTNIPFNIPHTGTTPSWLGSTC